MRKFAFHFADRLDAIFNSVLVGVSDHALLAHSPQTVHPTAHPPDKEQPQVFGFLRRDIEQQLVSTGD
ncbi:MAG: hypothetical protein M3458_02985 [Acidobacteriota bacterium]|nr:hypothetical protein [Acidobacteriota bacterium]